MAKSLPLVQLQLVEPLLGALRDCGVDPEPVLASVGLTLPAVKEKGASVHVMVMHQFVENCAKAAGDKTFCARTGARLDPTGWPMVRNAFDQATTLGGFLNIYVAQAIKVATSVTPYVEVRGDTAVFGEKRIFEPLIKPAQNDGFMIGMMLALLEKAIGHGMEPNRVLLVVSDPSVLPDRYRTYQTIRGNYMGASIQFPSEWLARSLADAEAGNSQTASGPAYDVQDFLSGFRAILMQKTGNGKVNATDAAEFVHMGQRTLARRLARLGTSISAELWLAKLGYAKNALKNTDRPIAEIASDLGYTDPSNFTRAFYKEEQKTPTDYRKTLRKKG